MALPITRISRQSEKNRSVPDWDNDREQGQHTPRRSHAQNAAPMSAFLDAPAPVYNLRGRRVPATDGLGRDSVLWEVATVQAGMPDLAAGSAARPHCSLGPGGARLYRAAGQVFSVIEARAGPTMRIRARGTAGAAAEGSLEGWQTLFASLQKTGCRSRPGAPGKCADTCALLE